MSIPGGLEMTTSKDVLEACPRRRPAPVLVTLGYSGWAAGQLEDELGRNGWLTVDADPAVIFDTPVEQRYDRAVSLLGFDPRMLSRRRGTHEPAARHLRDAAFWPSISASSAPAWPAATACCARPAPLPRSRRRRCPLRAIAKLIAEWQPDALVVGVPFHPDGARARQHPARARFARQLHGRFGLPVHEVDERYSTTEALAAGARDADAAAGRHHPRTVPADLT
jgi:putative transcription antitermination factor YqgF